MKFSCPICLFCLINIMPCFHTAIAIAIAAPLSLSLTLNPFPLSDSLLNYIGIAITIAKKWVQYPIVSDVAIAIANTQWKQPH